MGFTWWFGTFFRGFQRAFDSRSLLVIESALLILRPVDTCPVTLLLRTRNILQLSCLVVFLFSIYIYIKYILYNAFEHPFVSRQLRHLQISRMFRIQILARTGNCRRQVDVKQRLRRNHWRYNKLQLFDVYCIYIYICISYNCCNC